MSSPQSVPRLSVGLAVYNGEDFLCEAIDSILAQTFTDFELIISDNASTDSTAQICEEYARKDARVRYSRNPTNIGGVNNENLTFTLARGEFFRLAAHDDVCAPTLFEKCIEALDANPDAVLVHTAYVAIDQHGNRHETVCGMEGTAGRAHVRFRQLSRRFYKCEATYGIVRSDVLRRTRLQQNYTGSDRVLLAELGLRGRFIQLEEPLFYKRFHAGNAYKDWRYRMAWFFPEFKKTGTITFPFWSQAFDYLQTLRRVEMPLYDRVLCHVWLGRWLALHSKSLARDVLQAGYMRLHSREWRAKRYADVNRWS